MKAPRADELSALEDRVRELEVRNGIAKRKAASPWDPKGPLMKSATDQWATPQSVIDHVARTRSLTLDTCADESNAKCESFIGLPTDSLGVDWTVEIIEDTFGWCNPPYGRGIGAWVGKSYRTAEDGRGVVMLLPARTDTSWWHDYVLPFGEIEFIRGRLKFGSGTAPAPFPSALVTFHPEVALCIRKPMPPISVKIGATTWTG